MLCEQITGSLLAPPPHLPVLRFSNLGSADSCCAFEKLSENQNFYFSLEIHHFLGSFS
jgi:hypothetical protein